MPCWMTLKTYSDQDHFWDVSLFLSQIKESNKWRPCLLTNYQFIFNSIMLLTSRNIWDNKYDYCSNINLKNILLIGVGYMQWTQNHSAFELSNISFNLSTQSELYPSTLACGCGSTQQCHHALFLIPFTLVASLSSCGLAFFMWKGC